MKNIVLLLRRHSIPAILAAASFVVVAVSWGAAILLLKDIREPLAIHFNEYAGINQIGGLWELSYLGFFGIFVSLLNAIVGGVLEKRSPFLGRLLAAGGLVVALLISIAFGVIITTNV